MIIKKDVLKKTVMICAWCDDKEALDKEYEGKGYNLSHWQCESKECNDKINW